MVNNIPGVPPPVLNPTAVAQSQPSITKDGFNKQTAVVKPSNDKKVKDEKGKKNSHKQSHDNDENDSKNTDDKPEITATNIAFVQDSLDNKKLINASKGYNAYKTAK